MSRLVTAVMITGKHPERRKLALAAVRSFASQTYQPRRLLILNDGPQALWPDLDPTCREIAKEIHLTAQTPRLTLGALRNLALDIISEGWIAQWDDDDWSAPQRLERQMQLAVATGCPVTLGCQVRYSFENNSAYVYRWPSKQPRYGIAGTILHPVTPLRYPQIELSEDAHFVRALQPTPRILRQIEPHTYLRFHHAYNSWNAKHIMRRYAQLPNVWDLPSETASYLREVLLREYAEQLPQATLDLLQVQSTPLVKE